MYFNRVKNDTVISSKWQDQQHIVEYNYKIRVSVPQMGAFVPYLYYNMFFSFVQLYI